MKRKRLQFDNHICYKGEVQMLNKKNKILHPRPLYFAPVAPSLIGENTRNGNSICHLLALIMHSHINLSSSGGATCALPVQMIPLGSTPMWGGGYMQRKQHIPSPLIGHALIFPLVAALHVLFQFKWFPWIEKDNYI